LLKGFHYTGHLVPIFPLSGRHLLLGHFHSTCLLYGKSFKHIKLIISVTQFQLIQCAHCWELGLCFQLACEWRDFIHAYQLCVWELPCSPPMAWTCHLPLRSNCWFVTFSSKIPPRLKIPDVSPLGTPSLPNMQPGNSEWNCLFRSQKLRAFSGKILSKW
jgi:hypothetical protein